MLKRQVDEVAAFDLGVSYEVLEFGAKGGERSERLNIDSTRIRAVPPPAGGGK